MKTKYNPDEMKHINVPLQVKGTDDDGSFSGYGAVFGNVDEFNEVIEKGAFKESLKKHKQDGTMPAMLWQHDFREVIGVYKNMKEDGTGLYVEGQIIDTAKGKDAFKLLKKNALNGLSIGYMPVKYEIDEETAVLTHKEVDLWEVSIVTFPANTEARIQEVKNLSTERELEKFLRDRGFSRGLASGILAKARKIYGQRESGNTHQGEPDETAEKCNNIIKIFKGA